MMDDHDRAVYPLRERVEQHQIALLGLADVDARRK
jgi:hypothetical protein